MDFLKDSEQLVRYGGFAAGVLVLLLIVRQVIAYYASADERAVEKRLRAAIDAGDLRRAGDIQAQRGFYREAARIYERAEEHIRAARALAKIEDHKGAAAAFEKGKELKNAAPHYKKAGENLKAAECFLQVDDKKEAAECFAQAGESLKAARLMEQVGEYEKAADQYAKLEKLEPRDQALTMLENGALAVTDPPRRRGLYKRAAEEAVRLGEHERAARAFEQSGELARAADLYEHALRRYDVAAAIREELGEKEAVDRLTVAAGGTVPVLKQRELRARERGDGNLAKTLALAAAKLAPSNSTEGISEGRGEPRSGSSESRFEILGELGRGGMGVVFQARDRRLQRNVALKFLPDELEPNSVLVSIFRREARAAAALTHPAIVTVYDVGTHEGREYIAMEYVEGETLDKVVSEKGPLPIREALDVFEHVLGAVSFAHGKSVIHRDLKPSNLMRTSMGVKVMDFGLAKVVGAKGTTGAQTVVGGTPAYMPPEQLTGKADHRSDIFALGATFYELLTGRVPGSATQTASTTSEYPTPRALVAAVPARLSDLIMRCLDHDPALRPQEAGSILHEIREIRAAVEAAERELRAFMKSDPPKAATPSAPAKKARTAKPYVPIPREEEEVKK